MLDHLSGQVTALFLYEAAEVIDLARVATLIAPTAQARLSPKAATPSYVQYRQPPLTIDGEAIGLADALGFRVRFKLYDYGVISVALIRPLPSSWPELDRPRAHLAGGSRASRRRQKACAAISSIACRRR